jgi:hypothetical protein
MRLVEAFGGEEECQRRPVGSALGAGGKCSISALGQAPFSERDGFDRHDVR